jgi:hypothetical protein
MPKFKAMLVVLALFVGAACGAIVPINWSTNALKSSFPVSVFVQANDTIIFSCLDDAQG